MIGVHAPARICFFGDHQDYLSLPVIAGTIDRKITIEGTPNNSNKIKLQLVDINTTIVIDLDEQFNKISEQDYFRSVWVVLKNHGYHLTEGYTVEISGTIPINAGLSSSSALVVAWIRFVLAALNREDEVTDEQIGKWAFESEVTFFNQPGGLMDQFTIAQGGLLYIDTAKGTTERLTPNLGHLVVAESGIPKQTLEVLKNARNYGQAALAAVQENVPNFNLHQADEMAYNDYKKFVPEPYKPYWYAAIHNHLLTQNARKKLLSGPIDFVQIGQWMNSHQEILQECIQNTPQKMYTQMEAAKNAGALGAKIIGSGGGGCMVALVTADTKENVIDAFLKAGVSSAYEVNLTTIA
jgi:galactokinase